MTFNFDILYLIHPEELYTICDPTPVPHPQLEAFNDALASGLGLFME